MALHGISFPKKPDGKSSAANLRKWASKVKTVESNRAEKLYGAKGK